MAFIVKSRQWFITFGLLILVFAAIAGSFLTRDNGATQTAISAASSTEQAPLVDERPLKTARALLKLATTSDEQQVAKQAEDFADNEVDLAFHDASREAADHPAIAKPENRPLFDHENQAQAQVKTDQDHVDSLKKQLPSATGSRQDSIQEQLDVAQAQLELDQDELNDAKEDLVRSGADPGSLIQRQFDEHQAAEHDNDQKPAPVDTTDINYSAGSMIAQFKTWRDLHGKLGGIEQARREALQEADHLTQMHAAMEVQVAAEKQANRSTPSGDASNPNATQSASAALSATDANAVKSLHLLSDDQKNLADLDKRIQDERNLANAYGNWIALIHSHQRLALHGMLQSALWILLIVLVVYLAGRAIEHYLTDIGEERTRLRTLRAVIRFALQAVAVLFILLVVFGAPQQMPTILGLAGAGLTVALKDFIVAFVGWFVLMGKNGIRVGDWVEINGVTGEVIEINLLRTVLLETGNWNDTGHPTGRKVAFVNSYAIEGHFFNFTTSGQWLWDELQVTVPADRDPYALIDSIQKTIKKETEGEAHTAEEEWGRLTSHYRVRAVSAAPAVNLRPTVSGVDVHVRYITRAHERYAIRARLNQALVQLLRGKSVEEKPTLSAAK